MTTPSRGLRLGVTGWLVLTLAACPTSLDPPPPDPTPAPSPPAAEVLGVYPADDAEDVHPGTVLWADFASDPQGTFALVDEQGAEAPFEVEAVGALRRVLKTTSPLSPNARWTVSWSDAGGVTEWSFQTDAAPAPLDSALDARTFVLHLNRGMLVSPVRGEPFVNQFETDTLLSFPSDGSMRASLALGNSDPPEQDGCLATGEWDQVDWSDSAFRSGGLDVLQGFELPRGDWAYVVFQGWSLAGWIGGDAATVPYADVRAVLDMREVDLGVDCEAATLLLSGLECLPCPEEPEALECFELWYSAVPGEVVDGLQLDVVTPESVAADPDCDRSTD